MKYNSALKKKEILPFAKTWIDLESIMLGDIKQKEKDKYYMFSLLCEIKKNLREIISKMVASRDWGWEKQKMSVKEYNYQL